MCRCRSLRAGLFVVVALNACGGSGSAAPSAPSTPGIVNVSGLWTATVVFTSFSGEGCVPSTYALRAVGSRTIYSLLVTQSGSSLTALATNTADGTTINFGGTAGADSITLNATSASALNKFGFVCANGQIRDVLESSAAANATISGNSGTGTYAETDNVVLYETQIASGALTQNASFTMTR